MPMRCLTVTAIDDRVAHRLDAVGDQLRLGHQAGAERAPLHALARAAAVQVDLVVAPLLAQLRAVRQVGRLAAAQLQRDRMLVVVEIEVARDVAVQQRAGRHHLGVEPGVARDQAVEVRGNGGRSSPSSARRSVFACCISSNPYFSLWREQYDFPELPANAPFPHLVATVATGGFDLRSATPGERRSAARVTSPVRKLSRRGRRPSWARKVEAEMDARHFNDTRGLAKLTLKVFIDWYFGEIGAAHPFGKNKTAVLRTWQQDHGARSHQAPCYDKMLSRSNLQ